MAKKGEDRTFNISVIGLSGTERDKGPVGVGKSCLCNRFISYVADKYFSDHISVLSQSDFAGRVINNDHFLYWGEVTKTDDGNNFVFNVIEQSEFIDDVSFQPFKTGRTDPYYKRCVATKVQSAEKLMYICKDQLGMETDSAYEQKLMPEGKLNIDGYICCFDVSQNQQRTLEQQVEFVTLLLNGAIKTKKPVVVVTTKTDEANDRYVKEVERLLSKREYKNNIPLVGTSAHENVNVEQAFLTLAHMIDKTKTRPKIVQFSEAVRQRKELLDVATEAYRSLLRINIIDPKAVWAPSRKKLEKESDFLHYIEHFGTDSARKLFRLHIKHLCDEQIRRRESHYLQQLPDVLQHFLPDLNTITESWTTCQRLIRQHPDFDEYFVEVCYENDSWKTTPHFVDNYQETRIPFDLLSSCDAETCFRNHFNALQAQHRKLQLKRQFKKLLEETPEVSPGKSLEETYLSFEAKDCYIDLKQYEREQVYDAHQHDLKTAARHDFQELLWEKLEIFIHMSNTPNTITQEDIRTITKFIENDPRYRVMDRLDEERKVILFNLLGFMECPSRDRCYFQHACAEVALQNIFEGRTFRSEPPSISESEGSMKPLNLVLLGKAGLAEELCKEIRNMCNHDMFPYRNAVYSLDYRPIEEDVRLEYNSFATANFKPHGCLCVYNSRDSLEYVRSSLETTLLEDLQREENQTLHGVPIIILHAFNPDCTEKEHIILSHKGQELARSLRCEFKDIPAEDDIEDHGLRFSPVQIEESLIMVVRGSGQASLSRPCSEDLEPDLRIGMCLMCGDPFDCEIPLGPLLNSNPTQIDIDHPSSMFTINMETNVDNSPDFSKQKIEICISSYHNFVSKMFKDDEDYHMFHGFILVFSTKRKASFATMKAFAESLRNQMQVLPILILAVTDSVGSAIFFKDELSQNLISEGNQLADFLGGEFKMTTANFQQQTPIYIPFFKEAWYKRESVSESYYSVPSSPPAYGHSIDPKRPPAPLPRPFEIYPTTKSSTSNSQSTEESEPIYDQPSNLRGGPTSDSEQERPSSASPPPRTESPTCPPPYQFDLKNGERLVRPSMIRQRPGDHAAWAINEPRRPQKKASTFPSDAKLINPDNGRLDDDSRRSSEETIWRENELYHSRNPQFGVGRKPSKSTIQAPLALPEHIEISSDYATVKDVVSSPTPESDYASVNDALPDGILQRVRSQQRKKGNTDSEDSEFSSLEREREKSLYTKCNRKPTPHKKKTKYKPQTGRADPMNSDLASQFRHLRIRDREREPSNSPSDGSEGTGDELQLVRKEKKPLKIKKRRPPGGSESSGQAFSPQLSDSDNLAGSPPSHYRDLGYGEREFATLPRFGGLMATSMDSADLDLNDSGSWASKMKTSKKQRKEQQKIKEDEKRRKKEEERKQKEQQKMQKKKKKDNRGTGMSESGCRLQEFPMSSANPSLPQFVETCVEYIDAEVKIGRMHTEGIYRIPGNKQNVDLLNSKLQEDPSQDIKSLEIQVNAVATVLKNFFNETEPLIPSYLHDELLEAAEKFEDDPQEEMPTGRLLALRGVLKKLHPVNFEVLKYFITHLNRVSHHKDTHNMDTRNLALCLWPTILRIDFMSYDKMATGTKLPAEIIQTLIEQCGFFFHGEDEV
ncbi:rho GTPase-activating protein 5-like [Pecten maximus]|uniref:rho GTPase-activating protein 5-like n=1 Tax=Pecten maximus TaxID=6579 RepID=UPI00145912A2|nr:rho GTPase-activating protein 5-like [Pecten maximus]XP_033752622.1 rho GTPase-activating protein 5-like [Pecten maximus]XP_033752623.1 rho GTPase-activating protein 5-like [Pecten maximus]